MCANNKDHVQTIWLNEQACQNNINPIALRKAKTPESFGHFECNGVKI